MNITFPIQLMSLFLAEAPSFMRSLVLPLSGEEGLAAGDVGEPGLDGLAVHVHGEVVERRRHQALLHLANHPRLLRLLQLHILLDFHEVRVIIKGKLLSTKYIYSKYGIITTQNNG